MERTAETEKMLKTVKIISGVVRSMEVALFSKEHQKYYFTFLGLVFGIFITACNNKEYTPKPKGYFRIELPAPSYSTYEENCPFEFEYSQLARLEHTDSRACWMDIHYPRLKGKVHLSYKKLDDNVAEHIEDARTLVYKHTIKAADIQESLIIDKERKVYGLMYLLKGYTASSLQFYLTDSTDHFIRGALYFMAAPNPDSLAPAIDYVSRDMHRFAETFQWRE